MTKNALHYHQSFIIWFSSICHWIHVHAIIFVDFSMVKLAKNSHEWENNYSHSFYDVSGDLDLLVIFIVQMPSIKKRKHGGGEMFLLIYIFFSEFWLFKLIYGTFPEWCWGFSVSDKHMQLLQTSTRDEGGVQCLSGSGPMLAVNK